MRISTNDAHFSDLIIRKLQSVIDELALREADADMPIVRHTQRHMGGAYLAIIYGVCHPAFSLLCFTTEYPLVRKSNKSGSEFVAAWRDIFIRCSRVRPSRLRDDSLGLGLAVSSWLSPPQLN